jgi:hypothetical protein
VGAALGVGRGGVGRLLGFGTFGRFGAFDLRRMDGQDGFLVPIRGKRSPEF